MNSHYQHPLSSHSQHPRQSNTRARYSAFLLPTLFLLTLSVASVQAAPGDLDVRFGTNGKVTTPVGSSHDDANAMAIQPDGRILAVGSSNVPSTNYDFSLARYNTDGALDSSFGAGGKVTTTISNGDDFAYAVALQADGGIVVAGNSANGSNTDFALVRYNADGSLDTSFGAAGIVKTILGGNGTRLTALVIQPDGRIVAAGAVIGAVNGFALARYNTNGTLDAAFGTAGIVTTQIGSNNSSLANAVAIQADGKLVAAGYCFDNSLRNFALARYNTNGALDNSFGTGGKVIASISGVDDVASAMTLQPDGRIILAGFSYSISTEFYYFAVARFNTNGALDTSFNSTGSVLTGFAGNSNSSARGVVLQPDGKIVAAGVNSNDGKFDFALARYNADGTPDSSFGTAGKVTTNFGSNNEYANAVALQPDGKIVLAGYIRNGATDDFALARYQGLMTTTAVNPGDVLITEFRFNGPNSNDDDEFVELYNNTNNNIMVRDTVVDQGWYLIGSFRFTGITPSPKGYIAPSVVIPNGTVIPAHRHFLIALNLPNGFSLQNSGGVNKAIPDLNGDTFDLDNNGGIALYTTPYFTYNNTRLDAVGFTSEDEFHEGTPIPAISTATGPRDQYSLIRKLNDGTPQDTNDNAADFQLISPTGMVGTTPAALGAAGPENLFAPVYKSPSQISGQYLDPTAASTAQPNRVIESGVLKIRRTYTNNTGADVRRLRFRVFDLTTLNNTQGVPAPVADLRVISSQTETLNTAFGNKTALALTREEPPDQTTTLLDGGLHTTLSADTVTLTNPLRAGQSINVAYWLRVVAGGRFRFFVNIEATP